MYGNDELTRGRGRGMMMAYYSGDVDAGKGAEEEWINSSNPAKRALGKVGIGLRGVWEALPAF